MINVNIQIDGVDKTGKDLISTYVAYLSNHKYVVYPRGLISQEAYSNIYERDYEYDINDYKNTVFIYLFAEVEDLKVRHKMTHEPKIDIERDLQMFNKVAKKYASKVYSFNTSEMTAYHIAKCIIEIAEKKQKEIEHAKKSSRRR